MSAAFQQGWQYFSKAAEAGLAANAGQNYCAEVESAIETFTEQMYETVRQHGNMGVKQCKGFVAESWHANTFNINAVLKGSAHRASADKSQDLGSVDVSTNFGTDFSMKYFENAKKSADAQRKNYYEQYAEYLKRPRKGNPKSFEEYLQKHGLENRPEELLKSVYSGQYRVIPKDQLDEAIKYLETVMKIEEGKDGPNRALVYQNYKETLQKLTDRVADGEGVESIPLDKESAEVIAALCREGNFNAEDFGIDIASLVTTDYILQQALKAGYTAAVISMVMEVAPEVCEVILYLIKNGELNPEQLKEAGFAAVKGPALGFIRGYVSCALTIACNSRKLGKQFVGVEGNVIAAITVLAMDTVKNAWLVATGKMTGREMSVKTEDAAIITVGALIGGSVGTVLLPQLVVLGYMAGSFVGSVIGTIVAEGKNTLIMALCAHTGIALFGIVDQNYVLSEEMMKRLGLSIVELKTVEPQMNAVHYTQVKTVELKRNEVHSIEVFALKRGVIGVRRIGYV